MKTFLFSLSALALAASQAVAAPTCTMASGVATKDAPMGTFQLTVADTGVVYRKDQGQTPPQGVKAYAGTGRAVDQTVSCKDAPALCAKAKWYLRFSDATQGWPGDGALGSDPRVVAMTYDPAKLAHITPVVAIAPGMMLANGKKEVHMHYTAVVDGIVVAAYQPERGCQTTKDADGNPHTTIAVKP